MSFMLSDPGAMAKWGAGKCPKCGDALKGFVMPGKIEGYIPKAG